MGFKPGNCKNCGIQFEKKSSNHTFCSTKCKWRYNEDEKKRKIEEAARKHEMASLSFNEKARLQRETGISYGMRVAMRDKMFPTKEDILGGME